MVTAMVSIAPGWGNKHVSQEWWLVKDRSPWATAWDMHLVVCPKTSPSSQCKPVLVQHFPHHSPVLGWGCSAWTAGPAQGPGPVTSWRRGWEGAGGCSQGWGKSPLPVQVGAPGNSWTPPSSPCSNSSAGPQLLLHQPPALLSQLSQSWHFWGRFKLF